MEIEISRATLRQAKRSGLLALVLFATALGLRFAIAGWPALTARLAPRSTTTSGTPTATTAPANTERTIAVTPAPLSSPAATLIADAQPVAIVLHSANLRAGPGTDYILVGAAQPGDRLPIRGRTEAGDWWLVSAGAGTAWIFGELVEVQNAVSIPIAPAPPKTAANTISHSSPQFGFAYGIQAHLGSDIDRVIAATRDLGFSWIKGQLRWKDVEGSPGQVRWSEVDPLIDAVAGADLRLLLTIMAAPEWARPGGDYRVEGPPQEPALYAAKGHPSFFFLETLERYHSLMVTHGDARKRIWATEFGWPVDPTPPSGYEYAADNSEWEQSEFTRVAFQLGRLTDEQAQVICVMRQESERLRLMIDRLIARREVEALEMTEDGGRTTKAVCSSVMAPISDPM